MIESVEEFIIKYECDVCYNYIEHAKVLSILNGDIKEEFISDPELLLWIALYYRHVLNDVNQFIFYINKVIDNNDAIGFYTLAKYYYDNNIEHEEIERLLTIAANKKLSKACHILGNYYEFMAKDMDKAFEWYYKGYENNVAISCSALARLYVTKHEYDKATYMYKKMYILGIPEALGMLAYHIYNTSNNGLELAFPYAKKDVDQYRDPTGVSAFILHLYYALHNDKLNAIKYISISCDKKLPGTYAMFIKYLLKLQDYDGIKTVYKHLFTRPIEHIMSEINNDIVKLHVIAYDSLLEADIDEDKRQTLINNMIDEKQIKKFRKSRDNNNIKNSCHNCDIDPTKICSPRMFCKRCYMIDMYNIILKPVFL